MHPTDHPFIHSSLLLTTLATGIFTHFTKSEIAADITIILGTCGILNYIITWGYKIYKFLKNGNK